MVKVKPSLRSSVESVAEEVAQLSGGRVVAVYSHVFGGFAIEIAHLQDAEAVAALQSVARISPDRRTKLLADSQINPKWGLDRVDQRASNTVGDSLYRYSYTGDGVHIYVLDTGIAASQTSEFSGRVGFGVTTMNDGDCDASPGVDERGHGTAVAAVAAGTTYGVAKEATVHSVKVGCDDTYVSDVVAGLDWVASYHPSSESGPAVVNLSILADHEDIKDAIEDLTLNYEILVVKGAGNDDEDACNVEGNTATGVLVVGAITKLDERWSDSNWGRLY